MPSKDQKNITLNFFQLNPSTDNPDKTERAEEMKKIKEVFKVIPSTLLPIGYIESKVVLFGTIQTKNNVYLGTLIRSQISSIPPSYDEVSKEVKMLPLSDKQGLAYQTSFLYDPENRIVMIEAPQGGIGIGTLCAFLNKNFSIPSIEASLIINPAKLKEYYDMTTIRKFQVKVARLASGSIFYTKKNTAIGKIMHSADETNTDILEYTLGTRKNGSLKRGKITTLINSFLKYEDTKEVKKLIVTGNEGEESATHIDFIEQRLQDYITVTKERLISSFNIDDHYAKLLAVYTKHKPSLSIYKVRAKQ